MDNWKEYKLGEIIHLIGGGTPKTSVPEYWNGDIPWLSVSDFNNDLKYVYDAEKKITQLGLDNSSTKILSKEQIIISARGTVGVISMIGRDMAFNQSNYGIDGKEEFIENHFLYYLLKDTVNIFISNSYGAVFNTITKRTFDQIDVTLPPLPEQKAIAEVLSSLDDKIDLLHRQNKTLEQMAETLFRQWFVEEDNGEDWQIGTLKDEFEILMGQSPPGSSYNEEKIGMPMYQGNKDFGFRFPSNRVFTSEPKRIALKNDTLISVRAPVGAQNMANEECCIGRGVAAFRHKEHPEFYSYTFFKMRFMLDDIRKFNNEGTVFGAISKSDFEKMETEIPSKSDLEKIQSLLKPIDDKVISNSKQIQTLVNLRETLLPKLMSGEIRVEQEA